MGLDPAALDRYITGNYGEDFFRDDVEEIEPDEEEPTNPFYREPDLVPDAGGYDVFARHGRRRRALSQVRARSHQPRP